MFKNQENQSYKNYLVKNNHQKTKINHRLVIASKEENNNLNWKDDWFIKLGVIIIERIDKAIEKGK